jgi:D-psicose/D-tagatose/L-ribulose 3-epimerase
VNIEEAGLLAPVPDLKDRPGNVHIEESHRSCLGSRTVDFRSFFRSLAQIGYCRPVIFESFSSAVVSPNLINTLGIGQDSAHLAAHANTYIRS